MRRIKREPFLRDKGRGLISGSQQCISFTDFVLQKRKRNDKNKFYVNWAVNTTKGSISSRLRQNRSANIHNYKKIA
jgi:hypothetical protein